MIKEICYKNNQIALIIKNGYMAEGVKFITPSDSAQQVGFMSHPKNTEIKAHVHNIIERKVSLTQEVLIIKKGKLRLDLYSQEKEYIESVIISTGDVVVLPYGGHGLKCLEDVEMIEVKQGPYLGENDKERFTSVSEEKVVINE